VPVMHWLDEVLALARSHSPMVANTQRVPAGVCRQNGAVPVCAATVAAMAPNAMSAADAVCLMEQTR
jgi:hypothetical protein